MSKYMIRIDEIVGFISSIDERAFKASPAAKKYECLLCGINLYVIKEIKRCLQ